MNNDEKVCPYCAEIIKAQAIKCRYCGSDLSSKSTSQFIMDDMPSFMRDNGKSKNNYSFLIILAVVLVLFAFTNPTEKDFKYEMIDKIRSTEKFDQSSFLGKLAAGLASFAIDAASQRQNYIFFSIFEIDSSLMKIVNPDIPRLRFLGILGQVIPLFSYDDSSNESGNVSQSSPRQDVLISAPANQTPKVIKKPSISFEKYKVSDIYNGQIVMPDFEGKQREFADYRTRISEGFETGVDFAGHYTVIDVGCGTGCKFGYLGDVSTGEIFDFPLGGEGTPYAVLNYKKDSNLLVMTWSVSGYMYSEGCYRADYILEDNKFRLLDERIIKSEEECEAY